MKNYICLIIKYSLKFYKLNKILILLNKKYKNIFIHFLYFIYLAKKR